MATDSDKMLLAEAVDLIADIRVLYANDQDSPTWTSLIQRADAFLEKPQVDDILFELHAEKPNE